MSSVEKVKALCKDRKIPISRLERELGFSNGYIGQLRKGMFPADRLAKIADYFGLPTSYFLDEETEEKKPLVNDDEELTEMLEVLKTRPECRMLFQLSKNASKEDVEAAVRIIEALRAK